MISPAVFIRRHPHHFFAFHFSFKRTTHTTIGASSRHAVLGGPRFNHGFFH